MSPTELADLGGGRFASLYHRGFRVYFAGQFLSQTGTWLQNIGQIILVLRLAGTGIAVGTVGACQTAPALLLGLWAGAVIDRTDSVRLLLVLQTLQMGLALALGGLTLSGRIGLPAIMVIAALSGTCSAFDNPARRNVLGDLVPAKLLTNASNLHSAALTSARVIGPLLAGVIAARVNVGFCFLANGASFAVMLVALGMLSTRLSHREPPGTRAPGQVREGLRQVWRSRQLRATFAIFLGVATMSFNWTVLLPLLVRRDLHGSDTVYTVLLTSYSIGSVAGSVWAAGRHTASSKQIAVYSLIFGLTSLLVAASPNQSFAVLAAAPNGAASLVFLGAVMTSIQKTGSTETRGRLIALFYTVLVGSSAVGAPLMGWLADLLSPRSAIAIGGSVAVTIGLAGRFLLRDSTDGDSGRHGASPAWSV